MFAEIDSIATGGYTAVVLAIGGVIGWFIKHWKDVRGTLQAEKKENNDQALEIYKSLVETMQKELNQVKIDGAALDKDYISSREENAVLKNEIKHLKEKYEKDGS